MQEGGTEKEEKGSKMKGELKTRGSRKRR